MREDELKECFIPVADAAMVLGCSAQGIRYWIRKGCPIRCEKIKGRRPRTLVEINQLRWMMGEALTPSE